MGKILETVHFISLVEDPIHEKGSTNCLLCGSDLRRVDGTQFGNWSLIQKSLALIDVLPYLAIIVDRYL